MEQLKDDSALRTIGEVADSLNLPPHVLRFWETKFPQLKPNKRRGRHRYYRPEDVDTIRMIRHLLYEQGYTIKGAQKYLRINSKRQGEIAQPDLFAFQPGQEPERLKEVFNLNPAPAAEPEAAILASSPQQIQVPVATASATAPADKRGLSTGDAARLREILGEIRELKNQIKK